MGIQEFLLARIAEDEAAARDASGSTREGAAGNWMPAASGDRWAVSAGEHEIEVLVRLHAEPIATDGSGGGWGPIAAWTDIASEEPYEREYAEYVLPRAQHMARYDPARVLRECAAKRELVDIWHDEHGGGHVLKTLAAVYSDHPDYQQEWPL